MSEYKEAKNYVEGLLKNVEEDVQIKSFNLKMYHRGFLAGSGRDKLPSPRIVFFILSDLCPSKIIFDELSLLINKEDYR